MAQLNLASWNVNGIRAASGKGFFEWLKETSPDAACIQETKADPSQLTKEFFQATDGQGRAYHAYWASAKRRGYSGVAIYTRIEPKSVRVLGVDEYDDEGRYLEADLGDIVLASAYFPNSQEAGARLSYKLGFCNAVQARLDELKAAGRHVVLSGDYNIAHQSIDLSHPKANEGNPGYLPEERAWLDDFLQAGYTDTFRHLHPGQGGHYSWWSYRMRAREKDIGWRLDYHCVNDGLLSALTRAAISKSVMGSDHCPVTIALEL
ncbi:MAG TPA: exodeoxyribonuclease III [Spirochaetales bacterium]|nr:exodeoxyribonuclease III [Spirochaetales bacterium]